MAGYGRIVVVGASLAGLRAVEALRAGGHDGPITVVGAEVHRPYDRPPLSKHLLTGRVGIADVGLAVASTLDVEWRLGEAASGVDLARGVVLVGEGSALGFDGLVIATGAHARTLPFPPLAGVHLLRTLDDAVALRAELERGPRVVVIGAGFIGLEVAASSRALGLDVTVVEVAPVPLAAAALLHGDAAARFNPVPYFWSDHYDRKIQMVGRAAPGDQVSIVDGSVDERRFVAAYGRGGRLVAALGINRPAKVMGLGRRIAEGASYPGQRDATAI